VDIPRRRLAVVDMDPDIRASVREFFGQIWQIDEYGDESGVLTALKNSRPSVVLVDSGLERLDAFELLKQISRAPELGRTLTIMLTKTDGSGQFEEAHRFGAADVVAKPFDLQDLKVRIEGALARQATTVPLRQRIGAMLLRSGVISQQQLDAAVRLQKEHGGRLGAILVREGHLTELELVEALAHQLNIGVTDLHQIAPAANAIGLLPRDFIMRHRVMPLRIDDAGALILAMTDPLDVVSMDEVTMITHKRVIPVMCTESGFDEAVTIYLSTRGKLRSTGEGDVYVELEPVPIVDDSIIDTVDSLIADATSMRASDIHIEPADDMVRVRCRIDGVLHELREYPLTMAPGVTSRLKIMGNMDIAERRLPQDGRTSFETSAGQQVDLRLASIPSLYGENISIRLLEVSPIIPTLDDLGLIGEGRKRYEKAVKIPEGGIVIAGPTGSGKSTTLYATLEMINTPDRKIYTVEDPIERKVDGIIQTETKDMIGLTFARAMRSLVRADPDVIMVGEVRDLETARMASDAAITGHLVFTTVHANDGAATVFRLLEMGLPRYLVAAAFRCVVAQRLVRRLCKHCRQPETIEADQWETLGLGPAPKKTMTVFTPVGCGRCFGTGYLGRVGLFEVMPLDDALREIVTGGGAAADLRVAAAAAGFATVREDGVAKVLAGITSHLELLRVTV
jgi:type IV pilus assembly protein PilB